MKLYKLLFRYEKIFIGDKISIDLKFFANIDKTAMRGLSLYVPGRINGSNISAHACKTYKRFKLNSLYG